MKKSGFDLNDFLLHHVEKVILVVAIALLGLFFYLGFSTAIFKLKTPSQLSADAKTAERHIQDSESWNKIVEYRRGNTDATDRIVKAESALSNLDISSYEHGRMMGTKAKALGLRMDPEILPPVEVVAVPFRAPLLVKSENASSSPVSMLTNAASVDEEDDSNRPGTGGLGGGDFDEGQSQDETKSKKKEEFGPGTKISELYEQLSVGIRPGVAGVGAGGNKSEVIDCIAIFGLMKVKNQFAKFDQVFKEATAYYPDRDRPIYQYVEVQRREQKQDGSWSDWKDVNKRNRNIVNKAYPDSLYKRGAPEIIDPQYYDEVLTGKIPPIAGVDYRRFANHPSGKIPFRSFPEEKVEEIETEVSENLLDRISDDEDGNSALFGEDEDDRGRAGRAQDGRSRGSRGGSEGDFDEEEEEEGRNTSSRDSRLQRTGSNFSDYLEVMKQKEPKADYKLVRFFDINVTPGKIYQYRMRIWLSDPNNENPEGFKALEDATGGGRDTPNMGQLGLGEGEGGGEEEEEEKSYAYVKLSQEMTDTSVRERLRNPKIPKEERPFPEQLQYSRTADDWTYVTTPTFQFAEDGSQPTEDTAEGVAVPQDSGEFYAGRVTSGRLIKTPDGRDFVLGGDPAAEIVASQWNTTFDTKIPVHRFVQRGEVLNFTPDKPVHVLHPVDMTVRVLEEQPEIKTNAVVVDMIGGEKLPVYRAMMDFHMPGEILILDAQGKFRVQNDIADRKEYHMALFLDDESSEVGRARKVEDNGNFGRGDDDFGDGDR